MYRRIAGTVIRVKMIAVIMLLASASAFSESFDSGAGAVRSVYDGDTFNLAFRLSGIDTPEIKGKCDYEKRLAIKARDFSRLFFSKSEKLTLTVVDVGYYGRPIVEVRSELGYLNDMLLDAGLAVVYRRGSKDVWCE